LYDQIRTALQGSTVAMLVVPNFWHRSSIAEAPYFIRKLRKWADGGVEMMLHGWTHRDDHRHASAGNAFKARFLTAREGEFLGLSRAEAMARLRDGRRALEDATGRPVTGFVAPAWLYSPGTLEALGEQGFRVAEDHWRIWDPATGKRLAFAPVITWASRSRVRTAASLALAGLAPALLDGVEVARMAVHPGDVGVPAIRRSIERTLHALLQRRTAIRYADLAATRGTEIAGAAA
jgi:predicted deacetylase